jgi:hypothetical protein
MLTGGLEVCLALVHQLFAEHILIRSSIKKGPGEYQKIKIFALCENRLLAMLLDQGWLSIKLPALCLKIFSRA